MAKDPWVQGPMTDLATLISSENFTAVVFDLGFRVYVLGFQVWELEGSSPSSKDWTGLDQRAQRLLCPGFICWGLGFRVVLS